MTSSTKHVESYFYLFAGKAANRVAGTVMFTATLNIARICVLANFLQVDVPSLRNDRKGCKKFLSAGFQQSCKGPKENVEREKGKPEHHALSAWAVCGNLTFDPEGER